LERKKVGRNDPCPCGSGKKYKYCCWPKGFDEIFEKKEISRKENEEDIETKDVETTFSESLWWKQYSGTKSLEDKLRLLTEIIDSPEQIDPEVCFDAFDSIIDDLAIAGRHDEAIEVLQKLKTNKPDIYDGILDYVDENLILLLVRSERWQELEKNLDGFIANPDKYIDSFLKVLKIIRIHNQYNTVSRAMEKAYRKVQKSKNVMPWAKAEFSEMLYANIVSEYMSGPDFGKKKAEKTIFRRIRKYSKISKEYRAKLHKIIETLSGERQRRWELSQFNPKNKDYRDNLFWFSLEFTAYLKTNQITDYGLGENMRLALIDYFIEKEEKRENLFFFSPDLLDRHLGGLIRMFNFRFLEAFLLVQGLPLFYQFLAFRGLTDREKLRYVQRETTLLESSLVKVIGNGTWKFKFV